MSRIVWFVLFPALACGSAHSAPRHRPKPREEPSTVRVLYAPPPAGPCGPLTSYEPDEKIVQVIHGDNVDYTLTNRTLYVWRLVSESTSPDGQETVAKSQCSKTDMRDILNGGLIDWQLVGDTCYFFLKDRRLVSLPHGDRKALVTYALDFETASLDKNRICFFAGMIFFAPLSDNLTVLSLTPQVQQAWLSVDARDPSARFSVINDRLYFGVLHGVLHELVVTGPSARSVGVFEVRREVPDIVR